MGDAHITMQLHMQSPVSLSSTKQILASPDAWDLIRDTGCCIYLIDNGMFNTRLVWYQEDFFFQKNGKS